MDSLISLNDSIFIRISNYKSRIKILGQIDRLIIKNDSLSILDLNCEVKSELEISDINVGEYTSFEKFVFPHPINVQLDSSILNLGFEIDEVVYCCTEDYYDVKHLINNKKFNLKFTSVITQYRELNRIFSVTGSEILEKLKLKLKSIYTAKKEYKYYLNPSVENWFNWKGNEFLGWYSNYGQNPFKALSYCLWTMLYFSGFYFFFYSDWDKISKKFLIARFDNLISYFSSSKKLEDIYLDKNDPIIKSHQEFQKSLEVKRVFLPSFIILLAKPLSKLSLFKYYFVKRFYNSAEVLSENKLIDRS